MVKDIKIKTRDIALMGMFVALIIIGGFVKIPTPLVPITMQYFFCLLSGLLLGGVKGSICILIYVIMGLIGIPVFSSGGGLTYVVYPTFGYLIGFIVGALSSGIIVTRLFKTKNFKIWWIILAGMLALFFVYLFGVVYMYFIYKLVKFTPIAFSKALMSGCLIFLPTDIIWTIVASILAYKLIPIVRKNEIKSNIIEE